MSALAGDLGFGPARELTVETAAHAGAYATALVGLYALATSGPVGPLPLVVLAAAIGLAIVRGRGASREEAASLRTGLVTFLIAAVVVPVHSLLADSWVLGAVDLLVLVQANRLLALRTGGKPVIGQVLVVSLLMLMAAAVLTINFAFLGSVFLFCVVGTWTAIFRTLLDPDARGPDARVPRTVGGVAIAAGLLLFGTTCLLFGVLPRIQFRALQTGFLRVQGVSGFSEEVRLGELGAVKLDTRAVFRATLHGREVGEDRLYWRGLALDEYENGRWTLADPEETELKPRAVWQRRAMQFTVERPTDPAVQEIVLEPIDVSVVFGLGRIQRVEGELAIVTKNTTDSLFFRAMRFGRLRYVVDSDVSLPDPADVRDEAIAEVPDRYLQVPDSLKAALEPVARELAGEGSPWRKARRIETALQTWEYSLTPPAGRRADPVESFVLETRSGWCEQYSSAMVLMLRSLGIPARMTNGFHGGERNEFGDYWLVRNSDAHSWVEVPFAESGWVTFDPTPGQGPAARPFGGGLRRGFDWLRQIWTQRIVEYDLVDQFEILRAASLRAERLRNELGKGMSSAAAGARPVLGGAGVLVLGALAAFLVWRARRRLPAAGPARAAAEAERWWKLVERRFRRDGILRRAGETPRELAIRAGRPEWADLYYVARFGMRALTHEERSEMARIRGSL